ncbi:MAG: DUF1178 family protein [Deltaproteobacteria bacterium]|jgi:hypothetical protein
MIVFDLECTKGHRFEGWFQNVQSFESQNAKNMVTCPYCSDTQIKRVLSPVALKVSTQSQEGRDTGKIDYSRLAEEIVHYINKNFEDVGSDFAKEALKMHYGVAEKRSIKGSATDEEEKTLRKEKIDFFKLPIARIEKEKKS